MKRFRYAFVCVLLVVVNSSNVVASLTVTSETHHVWGWVEGSAYYVPPSQRWDYDYTDNNPVSGSAYYEGYEDRWYAESATGLLEVYAASNQTVSGSNFASANTDALWTFQPDDWSWLRLEVAVGWDIPAVHGLWYLDPFVVDVYDITEGSSLFYYSGHATGWGLFGRDPVVGFFPLDPTHEYRVHFAMTSGANNDGPWSGYIRATVIPAPGALFLGIFGLGFVGWLRRRGTL